MRRAGEPVVPSLVCPSCDRTVDLGAAVGGRVVCRGCRRDLDLVALVDALITLVDDRRAADDRALEVAEALGFTDEEQVVLDLLLQGYRVKQIAIRTGVTISTVRKRVRRLLAKTGTTSQAELVAVWRHGRPARPAGQSGAATARRSRSPRT
ncbi:MAG TPA: helix-turn-helix transcriptional regulator [Acidimicrobiia bacterium]|nr:helix-turn-helix transcriptional regulator [Acidimicrobiia bacterium]